MKTVFPAEIVFNSVVFSLKCIGITVDKCQYFVMTFVRRCFAVVLLIVMIAMILLIMRFWVLDLASFNSTKLRFVHVTSVYLMSTISFIYLLLWQHKNKFFDHANLLKLATGQKGLVAREKRILRISTGVIVGGWLSTVGMVGFGSYVTWPHTNSMFPELAVLMFDERLYYLVLYMHFYLIISCSMSCVSFILTCLLDKMEFKQLNQDLRKEPNVKYQMLETYIMKHTKLLAAVNQANDTFKWYLFLMLLIGVPSLVFDIYLIFVGQLSLQLTVSYCLVGLYFFSYDMILCIMASTVHSEIWKTADIILLKMSCIELEKSSEVYRLASWFVLKLVNSPQGLKIGGFLVITYPVLLTTVSFIASFLALLIQSFPTNPSSMSPVLQNYSSSFHN